MSDKPWKITVTDTGIQIEAQVGHNSLMFTLSDEQTSLFATDLGLAFVEAIGRRVQTDTARIRRMLGSQACEETTVPLPRPSVETTGTKH